MRTLILGAGGQIGTHLVAAADRREHVVQGTWYRRPLAIKPQLDLLDAEREAIAAASGAAQANASRTVIAYRLGALLGSY